MAYFENQNLIGTKDGANTTFTLANNPLQIDNVVLANTPIIDYQFTAPNVVELGVAPQSTDSLTASYWTVGSVINDGAPYELPSTLESLTFRVRTLLGEQFTEEWKDVSVTDWLNEAINVICTKADFPFMESESVIYTNINQEAYQLPAGFKKVLKVYYRNLDGDNSQSDTSNLPRDLVHRDDPESLSSPFWYPFEGYTLLGNTIIIPKPSQGRAIRLRYYRYLPYFDANNLQSRSLIPRQYEDMLIDYAVMRGRQQEEIYDVAQMHDTRFKARLDDMVFDTMRRVDNDSPSIRPNIYLY